MNMINVFILSSLSPPVECFVCPWSSNVVMSMYCVCVVRDSIMCGVWDVFVCCVLLSWQQLPIQLSHVIHLYLA